MTAPEAAAPAATVARLPLRGLAWQRTQLHLRLGPPAAGAPGMPEPHDLRLVPAAAGTLPMPPTWAGREPDGGLVARFNVMSAPARSRRPRADGTPDLRPLRPGRWNLAAASAGSEAPRPLALVAAAGVDPAAARAAFVTDRGEYSVSPGLDAAGVLSLEVAIDPAVRPPADPLRRRAGGDLLRRLRRWLFLCAFLLAAVLRPVLARRRGRRIVFLSHYGTHISGDMQAILARMAERGLDRDVAIDVIPPRASRGLRHQLRLPVLLAWAGTIVIDEDVLYVLPWVPGRVIQLWHASGALKTIGFSRVGKPGARSPWSRHYRYFSYAIVSGEHDVPLFAEAFGIPEERVIPTGHPRMDRFFDPAWRARAREATYEQFPAARGRRVILFAPTWRQSPRGRVYDLGILDLARLHALCVEKDAVFVIRLHPTTLTPVVIPEPYRDRILDGSGTVMDAPDLLAATDLLITDYSSIVLEYSLFGRPMLFFAHDLAEYKADRDVYMPYEEFVPGRIVTTFDELLDAIRRDDYHADEVQPFAERHFSHFDGGATDRVVELILGRPPR